MNFPSNTMSVIFDAQTRLNIQGDQNFSVHLMITVSYKNMQQYFKNFQSLTMIP
jgi:hypothetical protein